MWNSERSAELYGIAKWGRGFFRVDADGNVLARPHRERDAGVALPELVEDLRARGVDVPVLIRFADIARDRVAELQASFDAAIADCGYQAHYRAIYPLKVNAQRAVVEAMLAAGQDCGLGLETGSKAELIAALGLIAPGGLIVCNGYKDREYLALALHGARVGLNVVPVIEKLGELSTLMELWECDASGIDLGIRARLSTRGAGPWETSGGDRAKFGLTATETLQAVEALRAAGRLQHLKLLHFHIGSQIGHIRSLRAAVREAAHIYVELCRAGAEVRMIDVGGGLAVDYDGSRGSGAQSTDYSWQEYASAIVSEVASICDEADQPHPTLLSESGRALSAHHSVLVTTVLGTRGAAAVDDVGAVAADRPAQLCALQDIVAGFDVSRPDATLHEVCELSEQLQDLFRLGRLSLPGRAEGERLYAQALARLQVSGESAAPTASVPDLYTCNLSLFQSLPDVWAIEQIFPIMPIQGLDEEPTRRATLADITCDSHGTIERFVSGDGVVPALPVHALPEDGTPYCLGVFLVGAYQEILGGLHNLLGNTPVAHVLWDADAEQYRIDHVAPGDSIDNALAQVQHSAADLMARFQERVDHARRRGALSAEQGERCLAAYREGFAGTCYFSATTT